MGGQCAGGIAGRDGTALSLRALQQRTDGLHAGGRNGKVWGSMQTQLAVQFKRCMLTQAPTECQHPRSHRSCCAAWLWGLSQAPSSAGMLESWQWAARALSASV